MIYLRQIFNLHPASPRTRDSFCAAAVEKFLPALPASGGALVAAWFSHDEWYSQIEHVLAFENLEGFGLFREAASAPSALGEGLGELGNLAFERREELLEDLGPIPTEALAVSRRGKQSAASRGLLLRDSGSRPGPIGRFSGFAGHGRRLLADPRLLDGRGRESGSRDRSLERRPRRSGLCAVQRNDGCVF